MITTLIFDFDNTLIATREIDELACKDVSTFHYKLGGSFTIVAGD